jgi:hypothetical protein
VVMTRELTGLYQEDPRSQKRDLGHPSVVSDDIEVTYGFGCFRTT